MNYLIKINNKNYQSMKVATLFPPESLKKNQKEHYNMVVLEKEINQYYQKYETNTQMLKRFWATLYRKQVNLDALIIYQEPNFNSLTQNIVRWALNHAIDVYFRKNLDFNTYEEITKAHNIWHGPDNNKEYKGTSFSYAPEIPTAKTLSDKTKTLIRRCLRYYDLDTPQDEAEWILIARQVIFYQKNKIPFSIDSNQYTICSECKDLVRRGLEEEHICYAPESFEQTKWDYLVNGGE